MRRKKITRETAEFSRTETAQTTEEKARENTAKIRSKWRCRSIDIDVIVSFTLLAFTGCIDWIVSFTRCIDGIVSFTGCSDGIYRLDSVAYRV